MIPYNKTLLITEKFQVEMTKLFSELEGGGEEGMELKAIIELSL